MPGPDFEAMISRGNASYSSYLERLIRSAQSTVDSAEASLKTTNRFNFIRRAYLTAKAKNAQRTLSQGRQALFEFDIEQVVKTTSEQG